MNQNDLNNAQNELRTLNVMEKLMLLPSESQKNLQEKAEKNHQLHLICEAQNAILSQYSDSYNENSKAEAKINEVEEKIKKVDFLLENANHILLKSLKREPNKENEIGNFLKEILEKIKSLIITICNESLQNNSESVSIMTVIDIEQQIKKIIDNLISNGMYFETESQMNQRAAENEAHNEILLTFLRGFVDEAKRSQ